MAESKKEKSYKHVKESCAVFQEGGICPDCYCDSTCKEDSCHVCGGNTPGRIDDQIAWLEKKIADTEEEKSHKVTIQTTEDGKYFLEIPQVLLDELGWKVGDEVEWEATEICEDWGEHKGFTLSNLTKNPYSGNQEPDDDC